MFWTKGLKIIVEVGFVLFFVKYFHVFVEIIINLLSGSISEIKAAKF